MPPASVVTRPEVGVRRTPARTLRSVRSIIRVVDGPEGLPAAQRQAVEDRELAGVRAEGQHREGVAGQGLVAAEQAHVERAVERGRAGDGELVELRAKRRAGDVDVEGAGRGLRVIAGNREDAGAADAGADRAGAGDIGLNGAGAGQGSALVVG